MSNIHGFSVPYISGLDFRPCINHHILSGYIMDGDAAACAQRVNAIKSHTARYSGSRALSTPTPKRCQLA